MDEPLPPDDSTSPPPVSGPAPARPAPERRPAPADHPRPARVGPPPRPGAAPDRGRRPGPAPAPARLVVESAPRDPLRLLELPSRALAWDDQSWVVREGGRSSAGIGRSVRAPLLHLTFALAAEPDRLVKEVLTAGRGMADLSDDELIELLGRARPYEPPQERQEVFPDTRKKGGKGM